MENKNKSQIAIYKEEIKNQLADPAIMSDLLSFTFKGLTAETAKRAMLEGMMTGYDFINFLQKDVYAIPFGSSYSLVSSIDYSRKIGMRSGVVGVSAPIYVDDENGNIITCEITVKRKVDDTIGEFTAKVYFSEYNTKRNQWASKPRTMIAKVAEMHALRKACPEQLAKSYIEEEREFEINNIKLEEEKKEEKTIEWKTEMEKCKTIEELSKIWAKMPGSMKSEKVVVDLKEELKIKLSPVEGEIVK